MKHIYNNLAAIYLAIQAAVLAWLYGGTQGAVLAPVVPWMVLFAAEIVLVFPQKHDTESTYEARSRVWRALKKDPLVWTALGLLLLLAIPFANNGLCTICDRALIAQGFDPKPPISFLPFCVDRLDHLNVFLWFVAAMTALIVAKHALVGHGKRLVMKLLVWNGVALAVLGFVQIACGAPGPLWQPMLNTAKVGDFFSTWGYPNMAGDYFVSMFAIAAALWRRAYDDVEEEIKTNRAMADKHRRVLFWKRHKYLIPVAIFFFAALNTLSRAAIILVSCLALVFFVHTFFDFTRRMHRVDRLKKGTITLAVMGLIAFFASISMPEDLQREVDTLDADTVLKRVSGKGQYHCRVASEIWHDNLLFGCGGWGYKHFCVSKMTAEDRKQMQMVGGINVHNDYIQFLAEHGLVGFGAMVALVLMLVVPVLRQWREMIKAARFVKTKGIPAWAVPIFAMPAPVLFILLAAVATVIHGFGDCPLRSPAVLTLFYIELAVLPGFMPKKEED